MAPFRSWSRGATRVTTAVALAGIALAAVWGTRIGSPPVAPAAPALPLLPPGDTTAVYGPVVLSTPNGNPTNHTEQFAVTVIPGKRYVLRLVNGDAGGGHRVTSGTVRLNGWETITSAELGSGAPIDRVVQARTEDTLFATVQGTAGAYVTVSVLETADASFIVFGPEHFVRTTGTPVTELRAFSIGPTAAPPYRLCLKNGADNGSNRVSSATILVNHQEVFSPNNFNQQVSALMAQVTLQQANTLSVTLAGQPGGFVDICVTATDTTPPVLAIIAPPQNFVTYDTLVTVSGTVQDETPTTVTVNGQSAPVTNGSFSKVTPLPVEGHNTIHIVATDAAGHVTDSTRMVIRDRIAPVLTVTAPPDQFITKQMSVLVSGTVQDSTLVTVNVNGIQLIVGQGGIFSGSIPLTLEGLNLLTVTATDAAGNQTPVLRTVRRDTLPPVIAVNQPAENDTVTTTNVTVSGTVTDSTLVTLTVNGSGVTVGQGGAYSTSVALVLGLNTITLVATDQATNSATFQRHVFRKLPLPPDPATVANVVNRAEATLILANTSFLYTGTSPIQTGVAAGTIDTVRAAVIRGRVLDKALQPLGGVVVKILNHSEFGQTLSRQDGGYDLAVNGGSQLTVSYALGGYLPAQRAVDVPWQDYTRVNDVILLRPDTVATVVALNADSPSVARASVATDADGSRQATIIFKPGNTATLTVPGSAPVAVSTLTVRATEFTIGNNGPLSMPAVLPPASHYTYAVQITADTQIAAGAGAKVTLAQPVPIYVENFLEIPIGTKVPVGVYDATTGSWIPKPNGMVLQVLSPDANGRARIDVTGDSQADPPSAYAGLGIDDYELVRLAGVYPSGANLWRALAATFEPLDLNFPFIFVGSTPTDGKVKAGCSSREGDPLRCQLQAQTAFQQVGIVGSPFTLNYASDRTQGNVADRKLNITLTGANPPAQLIRVELEVDVAGQRFTGSFSNAANQTYTFSWDGRDLYGRLVQGTQPATVLIGYVFPVQYAAPANAVDAFGLPCAPVGTGTVCPFIAQGTVPARAERVLVQRLETSIGTMDAVALGLGGFTLDVQNFYDPIGEVMYNGDGTRRATAALPPGISTVAGKPGSSISGVVNNAVAKNVAIFGIWPIGAGPDGSMYFADKFQTLIQKLTPDGRLTTILGRSPNTPNCTNDDSIAIRATVSQITGIAVASDGTIYFSDMGNCQRVRKIDPSGVVRAVAGVTGSFGYNTDTLPATQSLLFNPSGVAVGPDGSLYINDQGNKRIRRVAPDGRISTVAGDGTICGPATAISTDAGFHQVCGNEGIIATKAKIGTVNDMVVGPDGSIYISAVGRIRRVAPDGTIRTFAGSAVATTSGDGGLATLAGIPNAWALAIGPEGSVYVSQFQQPNPGTRIRRVASTGIITTFVGNGNPGFSGDGGPAAAAQIGQGIKGMAIGKDGNLYIVDLDNARIRKVAGVLPGFGAGQTVIASADGRELYVFSASGRILQTLDFFTRDTIYAFTYDANRQLVSITDRNGRITQIIRNSAGRVDSLIAPIGAATRLAFDAIGNISAITDPSGGELGLGVQSGGMLANVVDYRSNEASANYDSDGLLTFASMPSGGQYSRTVQQTGSASSITYDSPLGRATTVSIRDSSNGDRIHRATMPSGAVVETSVSPVGRRFTRYASGMTSQVLEVPDPILGMQGSLWNVEVRTPSGLLLAERSSRGYTLTDPDNPSTIVTVTDSAIVNGRIETVVTNKNTQTTTRRTPAGRLSIQRFDVFGRAVSESLPNLVPVVNTYDSAGRVMNIARGSRTIRFYYGSLGLADSVMDVFGGVAHHSYTGTGLVTRTIFPSGDTIRYEYDENGNRSAVFPPGRAAHAFTFSPGGAMESYTPPDLGSGPATIRWERNDDGQIVRIVRPDSQQVVITYDSAGRQHTLSDTLGTSTFIYDPVTSQLKTIQAPQSINLDYEYDGDLRTATKWSGPVIGEVRNTFNANFLLSQETVNGQFPIAYSYDLDGNISAAGGLQITRAPGNGALSSTTLQQLTTTPTINTFAEVTGLEYRYAAAPILQLSLTRGSSGRIEGRSETVGGTTTTFVYGYDPAGRLRTVSRDGQPQVTYEYDANGNRLSATGVNGVATATYDAQDRLLSYGGTSFSYSLVGELLSRVNGIDTTKYRYTRSGSLIGVVLPNGTTVEYLLDGMGRRIGRKVNGLLTTGYLYESQHGLVAELNSAGAIVSRFVYATSTHVPDYMLRDGRTFRLLVDHLGSVRLVVDVQTGEVMQRIDYDEFGRELSNTNPAFQPFGFVGGIADHATGLVHFGMREYDPSLGRWITKDPVLFDGGDGNLYVYVANDPLNGLDPQGTSFLGYFFQKWVIEPILWSIAETTVADAVGGCLGSWFATGNLAGCPEEAGRGVYSGLTNGFVGGIILHGRVGKWKAHGGFAKGYPRKWNWIENFVAMCVVGAAVEIAADVEDGEDSRPTAAFGCAMGGLGVLTDNLGKWIAARPFLKGKWRIARAAPVILSIALNAFGTAFQQRFNAFAEDLLTPGEPCCSENPPGTFVRRKQRTQGDTRSDERWHASDHVGGTKEQEN